jgi:hypothetical protein
MKNLIKKLFVEWRARTSKPFGKERASYELTHALRDGSADAIALAIKKSKNWMTVKEIQNLPMEIVFTVQNAPYKMEGDFISNLIYSGACEALTFCLNEGIFDLRHPPRPSPFEVPTLRDLIFIRDHHNLPKEAWVEHARNNPEKWLCEDPKLFHYFTSTKGVGKEWLGYLFLKMSNHEVFKDFEKEMPRHLNFQAFLKTIELDKYITGNAAKEFFYQFQVKQTRIPALTYQTFIELGWCTGKEVHDFQMQLKTHLPNSSFVCEEFIRTYEKNALFDRTGAPTKSKHRAI